MFPNADISEKVKALTEKLEAGVMAVFNSERYRKYLQTMSKFHNYSFGNVMLILLQCPEASLVAGFNTWKKQFGRTVKKGEHGIQIIAPMKCSRLTSQARLDPVTQQPILKSDGTVETEPVFEQYTGYKIAYVFDVSQTEGRELPSYGVNELTGEVQNFEVIFAAVKSLSPVPVEYRKPEKSKGCYHHVAQKNLH